MSSLITSLIRTLLISTLLLLAACGDELQVGEDSGQQSVIDAGTPFAFVSRDSNNINALINNSLEPSAYKPGAKLYVRAAVSSDASDVEILATVFKDEDYDVKDLNVSSDGKLLIFSAHGSQLLDSWNLFEYEFETAKLHRIIGDDDVTNLGNDTGGAYTNDDTIIFSSDRHLVSDNQPANDDQSTVLFSMNRQGQDLQQITQSSEDDIQSTTLKDGHLVFMRWKQQTNCIDVDSENFQSECLKTKTSNETQPGVNEEIIEESFNLYRVAPNGEELIALYDETTLSVQESQSVQVDGIIQGSDGHLLAIMRNKQNPMFGGEIVQLKGPQATQARNLEGEDDNAEQSAVYEYVKPESVNGQALNLTSDTAQVNGWYSAFWPYRDGTDRMLVSWSQCMKQNNGVFRACENGDSLDGVESRYGIWVMDVENNTRMPILQAQKGTVYTEIALGYPNLGENLQFDDDVVEPEPEPEPEDQCDNDPLTALPECPVEPEPTCDNDPLTALQDCPLEPTCDSDPLTELPACPVEPEPVCDNDPLTALPECPVIPEPTCDNDPLTALPECPVIPEPTCDDDPLTALPECPVIPEPTCDDDPLTAIPECPVEPEPTCDNDPLTDLPACPVEPEPTCDSDPLTAIPACPVEPEPTCDDDPLTALPECSVEPEPTCDDDPLTALPECPVIPEPTCDDDPLTALPECPVIPEPTCDDDPLTAIPECPIEPEPTCDNDPLTALPECPVEPEPSCDSDPLTAIPACPVEPEPTCDDDPLTDLPACPVEPEPTCDSDPLTALPECPVEPEPTCDADPLTDLPACPVEPEPTCDDDPLTALPECPVEPEPTCDDDPLTALPECPVIPEPTCDDDPLTALPECPVEPEPTCDDDPLTALPECPVEPEPTCDDDLLTALPECPIEPEPTCDDDPLTALPECPIEPEPTCDDDPLTALPECPIEPEPTCDNDPLTALPECPVEPEPTCDSDPLTDLPECPVEPEPTCDDDPLTDLPECPIDPSNHAPIANAGVDMLGLSVGDSVFLDGGASSDADGDTLTYSWTVISAPTEIDVDILNDATSVQAILSLPEAGFYVIELTVSDGTEFSEADTVMIEAGADEQVCVPGKKLSIWSAIESEENQNTLIKDAFLGHITSFQGSNTPGASYDYYSYSAHPTSIEDENNDALPQPKDSSAHIFFYESTAQHSPLEYSDNDAVKPRGQINQDDLFLYFFFNKDAAGQSDNKVYFEVFTDNNLDDAGVSIDQVILSDDGHELLSVRSDESGQHYIGDYQYWYNTDGGVIGPFRGEEFTIAVRATSQSPVGEDLTGASFFSREGTEYNFFKDPKITSFIVTYKEEVVCNPTDPTSPEAPEEGTDPIDPTDPTSPEAPEEGTDPADPTDPTSPEAPEEGTDPTCDTDPLTELPQCPVDPTCDDDPFTELPACPVDPLPQPDLTAQVHIHSIYDVDGEDESELGLLKMANPTSLPMDQRSERFVRVLTRKDSESDELQIQGYAPIQPDGSVIFKVPADVDYSFEIVNRFGKALNNEQTNGGDFAYDYLQRHSGFLQAGVGEKQQCTGCHESGSDAPHGYMENQPVNDGALSANIPWPNTSETLVASLAGDTMAETWFDNISGAGNLQPTLSYQDNWTPTPYRLNDLLDTNYDNLQTPAPVSIACQQEMSSDCPADINYNDHIKPLWEITTRDDDGNSCVDCHDNRGFTSLNLSDVQSRVEGNLASYDALFNVSASYMYLSAVYSPVDSEHCRRDVAAPFSLEPESDCFSCYDQSVMNIKGALPSANFFDVFALGQGDGQWLFRPQLTEQARTDMRSQHGQMLSTHELKLIAEWLDMGAVGGECNRVQ